jgi:hypothetical protein
MTLQAWYAGSLLLAGEEAEALRVLGSLLDDPPTKGRTHLYLVRNALLASCPERPGAERAAPALVELVEEVTRRLRRRKRAWCRPTGGATWEDLATLLQTTRAPAGSAEGNAPP